MTGWLFCLLDLLFKLKAQSVKLKASDKFCFEDLIKCN